MWPCEISWYVRRILDQPCEVKHSDHMTNLLHKSLNELPAKDSGTNSQMLTDLMESVQVVEQGIRRDGCAPKIVHTVQASDDSDDEPVLDSGSSITKRSDTDSDQEDDDTVISDAKLADLVGKDKFLGIFRSWLTMDTLQWSKDSTENVSVEDKDSEIEGEGEASYDPDDATLVFLPLVLSATPSLLQRTIFMEQLRAKYAHGLSSSHSVVGGGG